MEPSYTSHQTPSAWSGTSPNLWVTCCLHCFFISLQSHWTNKNYPGLTAWTALGWHYGLRLWTTLDWQELPWTDRMDCTRLTLWTETMDYTGLISTALHWYQGLHWTSTNFKYCTGLTEWAVLKLWTTLKWHQLTLGTAVDWPVLADIKVWTNIKDLTGPRIASDWCHRLDRTDINDCSGLTWGTLQLK